MESVGAKMPVDMDVELLWSRPGRGLSEYLDLEAVPVLAVRLAFRIGHGPELADELGTLLNAANVSSEVDHRLYHSTGDYSVLIGQTVTIFGAAGGLAGAAAVLKTFFERHNSKKVKFGDDGQLLEVEGLTAGEIARLLEARWEQRQIEGTAAADSNARPAVEPSGLGVPIDVCLELRRPRREVQGALIRFRGAHEPGLGAELELLAREAGLETEHHRFQGEPIGDYSTFVAETVRIHSGAEGLAGMAVVLKAFFGSHVDMRVRFGEEMDARLGVHRDVLEVGSLSTESIVGLMEAVSTNQA